MPDMTSTRHLLAQASNVERNIHPITWSNSYRQSFQAVIDGLGVVRTPADLDLAPIFLLYALGELGKADPELTRVAIDHLDRASADQEAFISLLFAFYVAQRYDIVSSLLVDRYGFPAPLEIRAVSNGPGDARVVWTIENCGAHRFEFDARSYGSDRTRNDILAFQWIFPLLAHYAHSAHPESGSVILNQGDLGNSPGLSYCDSRPNYFLIPDYIFVPTRAYAYNRSQFDEKALPWSQRKAVAMWRGATTGARASINDWRSLERVRMCQTLRECPAPELFDVGLSSVVQFNDPAVIREIDDSGLKGNFIPADQWFSYKYLIDIDGNSSPWSNLFQKLLSGSTVLKVESHRGLQQWYYDSLKPWKNYVPISSDFGDIVEKVRWLKRHDSVAEAIGRSGREFAHQLSYERELERAVPVISAAFRYFRGDLRDVAPFGRVAPDNSLRQV